MKPAGLADLFDSERGVFAVALLLASLALVLAGKMPIDAWIEYSKWLGTLIIASKTVTTALQTIKGTTPSPAARTVTDTTTTDRSPSS